MKIEFSKRNKNNVCDAIEGKKSYKKLSPAEWHQFVQNYNYDDGNEPFFWLVEQSFCDKGTALCLYWYLQPDFFVGKTIDESDINYDEYKLLKKIEEKFLSGFYQNENFSFDPTVEFIKENTNINGIPKEMTQKTNGTSFERLDVEYAFLRFPTEKELKTISRKIHNAIGIVKKANLQFSGDEDSDTIIKAIIEAVDYFKAHDVGKLKINDLSFLWLDCIHKKYNWSWIVWDWETGRKYGVSNPAKVMVCLQDTIIVHTMSGFQPSGIISKLYSDLCGVNELREMKHSSYTGIGLLNYSGHLQFKD